MVRRQNEAATQASADLHRAALDSSDVTPNNPLPGPLQNVLTLLAHVVDEKTRFTTQFRQTTPPSACAPLAAIYGRYLSVSVESVATTSRNYIELVEYLKRPGATQEGMRAGQEKMKAAAARNAQTLQALAAQFRQQMQALKAQYPALPENLTGWSIQP